MKPITPDQAREELESKIPEKVFEAFNQLIVEKLSGSSARINLEDAKLRVESLMGLSRSQLDTRWFDVEPFYRKSGWKVEFDKPAYYESYDSHFIFTKP